MNPKRKKVLMHKAFCIKDLVIETFEELGSTNAKSKKFLDDIIGYCEEMNNSVSDTETIQKHTYFSNISNKIDTILRKEFNENM